MAAGRYLAFDLGAESGRAMRGGIENGRIVMQEVHRFPTGILELPSGQHWNIYRLYEEILAGIIRAVSHTDAPLLGMGIDTWGVDFGLLDASGRLLCLPYSYRDPRTRGAMERFFHLMPRQELYARTGVQMLPFNTVFQLFAMKEARDPALEAARTLLFIPDIFTYLLTGQRTSEFTFATTSGMFDSRRLRFDPDILSLLGLDERLLCPMVMPGQGVYPLRPEVSHALGAGDLPVRLVAGHDTASAVAAVPASGDNYVFISSGTWSLMGFISPTPVITDATREANLTNEGSADGGFRVLKNITGLWLLQGLRRSFAARGEDRDYTALTRLAQEVPPFAAVLDPDDPVFAAPPDMLAAFDRYLSATGQQPLRNPGGYIRLALESLAFKYRFVLGQLRDVCPRPIDTIHIIGGGVRNELLCRLTADACGLPVLAGPAEATALGNLLVQLVAAGEVPDLRRGRALVALSVDPVRYEPKDTPGLERAYQRFLQLNPR